MNVTRLAAVDSPPTVDPLPITSEHGNLVLSRSSGEQIVIGDTVITVCQIKGGSVQIRINAPRDEIIYRPEGVSREKARQRHERMLRRKDRAVSP